MCCSMVEITVGQFTEEASKQNYLSVQICTNYFKTCFGIKRDNLEEARDKVFRLFGLEYIPGDYCFIRYNCGLVFFYLHGGERKYFKYEIPGEILDLFF